MNLCKVSVLMALMLAMSCYAQDAAAPDEEMDDMNMGAMNMGEPVLDAIAELVCSKVLDCSFSAFAVLD